MGSLHEYYSLRASEYERIYEKPERQADLAALKDKLPSWFVGRNALEIACGTGYWTRILSEVAKSITAIDTSVEVLELARKKSYRTEPIILNADAYELDRVPGSFNAALAAFWWSHVPRQDLARFLRQLNERLLTRSVVVFFDNSYVEGSSTPIFGEDEFGNTFQLRKLADGTEHRVLKNFPDDSELRNVLSGFSDELAIENLEYYWIAAYRTAT